MLRGRRRGDQYEPAASFETRGQCLEEDLFLGERSERVSVPESPICAHPHRQEEIPVLGPPKSGQGGPNQRRLFQRRDLEEFWQPGMAAKPFQDFQYEKVAKILILFASGARVFFNENFFLLKQENFLDFYMEGGVPLSCYNAVIIK